MTMPERVHVTIELSGRTADMKWRWEVHAPNWGYEKGFTWTNKGAIRKAKRAIDKVNRQKALNAAKRREFDVDLR